MAQHEIPIGIGQREFFRAQAIVSSSREVKNPSRCKFSSPITTLS
jgi:hypothetical protein